MKKRGWSPWQTAYDKGWAVGKPDVREDAWVFRWWDEVYVVPSPAAVKIIDRLGDNHYAKRSALRKLEKKNPEIRWYPKEVANG